jgi:CheY-like chemotaxis protein
MTPETLARVFEPFFTTKEVGKGSGLGLSMVHGFMKQSRGHVKVYSELGRGTTVRLYLPRDRADAAGSDTVADAGEAPPAIATETVLIVEDNAALRHVAAIKLTKLGYRIIEAGNAAEALDIIDRGGKPDLLFSDVVMPGPLDGIVLAEEAVRRLPGLKVLLTSGFTERGARSVAAQQIRWPLLSKPYRNAELAQALRAALVGPAIDSAAD